MNQLSLSNDLLEISAEINIYKQQAGQAVFEIGKRLKHVKENDLAHGQWTDWLESIDITPRTAQRMMQAYEQFGNTTHASLLPSSKIFELLSLPESIDREQFVTNPQTIPSTGEQKMVSDMAREELREVKQQLKQAENESLHYQKLWQQAKEQPPKVVTQKIEVIPNDYSDLKEQAINAQKLNNENVVLTRKMREMQQEFNEKLQRQDEISHAVRKLRESFKNLLTIASQEHYNAKFFYEQIPGNYQAYQAIESFLNEFGALVNDMFIEWKDQIKIKVS